MLYLWKGTENRHITTAKWSIEHKDGELNIKGKITFCPDIFNTIYNS